MSVRLPHCLLPAARTPHGKQAAEPAAVMSAHLPARPRPGRRPLLTPRWLLGPCRRAGCFEWKIPEATTEAEPSGGHSSTDPSGFDSARNSPALPRALQAAEWAGHWPPVPRPPLPRSGASVTPRVTPSPDSLHVEGGSVSGSLPSHSRGTWHHGAKVKAGPQRGASHARSPS